MIKVALFLVVADDHNDDEGEDVDLDDRHESHCYTYLFVAFRIEMDTVVSMPLSLSSTSAWLLSQTLYRCARAIWIIL